MFEASQSRIVHFQTLWREGLWGRWIASIYFFAALFVFIRDDIWRPADESRWKIINMIPHMPLSWWLCGFFLILAIWIFEASFRSTRSLNEIIESLRAQETPFDIIFDPTNPRNKYWSIEPMRDENGVQIPGSYWEYRAAIKNKSSKTIRNVKVIVEAVGVLPTRPEHSRFDINKKNLIDLTPNEETLAMIRWWYNPKIVQGMVVGEHIYGPIKMTVSGDDVLPNTKFFSFDPMREPMISEMHFRV